MIPSNIIRKISIWQKVDDQKFDELLYLVQQKSKRQNLLDYALELDTIKFDQRRAEDGPYFKRKNQWSVPIFVSGPYIFLSTWLRPSQSEHAISWAIRTGPGLGKWPQLCLGEASWDVSAVILKMHPLPAKVNLGIL